MPIKFPVNQRTILLCNYNMGGFRAPEMVKRRPVVALTSRLPNRSNLQTVVPLSGTESVANYHCRIELDEPLPAPFNQNVWWVKADMLASVSLARLELFRTDRDQDGKRRYLNNLKVDEQNFEQIKEAVRRALGLV